MAAPLPTDSGRSEPVVSDSLKSLGDLTQKKQEGLRKGAYKGYLVVEWTNHQPTLKVVGIKDYAKATFSNGIRSVQNVFSNRVRPIHSETNSKAIKATALYMYQHNPEWKQDEAHLAQLLERTGLAKATPKEEPASILGFIGAPEKESNIDLFGTYLQAHKKELDHFFCQYTREAAENGDPQALYDLGLMYRSGHGVPEDPKLATHNLMEAAKKGHPQAMLLVGLSYWNQEHRNEQEAMHYLEGAAEKGVAKAQFLLGKIYEDKSREKSVKYYADALEKSVKYYADALRNPNADGTILYSIARRSEQLAESQKEVRALASGKQDDEEYRQEFQKVVGTYKRAAERGSADAQLRLGVLYEQGDIPEELTDRSAVSYYKAAAEKNHPEAQWRLGHMYESGRGVVRDGNEARWDREAVRLYQVSAGQGNPRAQCLLGIMYATGRGVARNDREAVRLFKLAKEQGDPEAIYHLGIMYENGRGVEKSAKEAFLAYKAAADKNYSPAFGKLGRMFHNGKGKEENWIDVRESDWPNLAVSFLEKAVKSGDTDAMCYLAEIHESKSRSVPKKAMALYEMAIVKGSILAMRRLADIYHRLGNGEKAHYLKAAELYERAMKAGDRESMYKFAEMLEQGLGIEKDEHRAQLIRGQAQKLR